MTKDVRIFHWDETSLGEEGRIEETMPQPPAASHLSSPRQFQAAFSSIFTSSSFLSL